MGALVLHGLAMLFRVNSGSASPTARIEAITHDSLDVVSEPTLLPASAAPGGGTERPDSEGTDGQTSARLPVPPRKSAPSTKIAAEPVAPSDQPLGPSEGPTAEPAPTLPAALLTHAGDDDWVESPRLRPARNRFLRTRAPSASGIGPQHTGRSPGGGFGAGTGPGGRGRGMGRGVVTTPFAFGGPRGAFRADICFFEPPVTSLKEIRDCQAAGTFFTDVLNVSPRSFTEGFPGLTKRIEWFRIEYRGKFSVATSDYYRFRLLSDDGAILYIDGFQIIDNDGQHAPMSREMTITLEAGEHDLRVSYYQGPRENIALQLFVKQYNHPERLFGPSL